MMLPKLKGMHILFVGFINYRDIMALTNLVLDLSTILAPKEEEGAKGGGEETSA